MRYALLDTLACPDDRTWPLAVEAVAAHASVPAPQRVYACAVHCARRDSHEPPLDLALCEACWETDVLTAGLRCPTCGAEFAVEQGVARLLPAELRVGLVEVAGAPGAEEAPQPGQSRDVVDKVSELKARDREVEEYDRMTGLALLTRLEWPRVRRALHLSESDRVLEIGCGTGRMTQRLCHDSAVLTAVDFSFESLVRCRGKLPPGSPVHLVQADATRLPLRDAVADKAVSCQVVEHLPSEEARRRFVSEVGRASKPGALFVGTAYRYSWLSRLAGKKEGYHQSGIYYFRFRRQELADLVRSGLGEPDIEELTPYLYLASVRNTAIGA